MWVEFFIRWGGRLGQPSGAVKGVVETVSRTPTRHEPGELGANERVVCAQRDVTK